MEAMAEGVNGLDGCDRGDAATALSRTVKFHAQDGWKIDFSYVKHTGLWGGTMESDHRYYSRRALEEQRLANRAITPEARERHGELARLFASKAQRVEGAERQLAN